MFSQVGVEFVASVDETSDFIVRVALILNFRGSLLEDGVAVLGHTKAHVVLEMSEELSLIHVLVFEKVGLLLKHANHHSLRVGLRVHHARLLETLSIFVVSVFLQKFGVRCTGNLC